MFEGFRGKPGLDSVKRLNSIEEMQAVVELQRKIWGYGTSGTDDPYPARALMALSASGGLVSMACVGNEPAGFALAWLGRLPEKGQLYLHSQLLGVVSKYRGRGIGLQLKHHQKEYALNAGIARIGWTYDPLRASTAYFNLHKLGAVSRYYFQDYYGEMKSRLSLAKTSDRLWADWHIDSEEVARSGESKDAAELFAAGTPIITSRACDEASLACNVPVDLELGHSDRHLLVEIPPDFDQLLLQDQSLAEVWRKAIQKALRHYLSAGYVADDFLFTSDGSIPCAYYRLRLFDLTNARESG
jgi:predicted GNAT superfamily acetyltransferase